MIVEFIGTPPALGTRDALVHLMTSRERATGVTPALASAVDLDRAFEASRFEGTADQVLELVAPGGCDAGRLVLIGIGDGASDATIRRGAAAAFRQVRSSGVTDLVIDARQLPAALAAHAALGVSLAAYRFDRHRSIVKPEQTASVKRVRVIVSDPGTAARAYEPLEAVAAGVSLTRDLVSEPPNILYPAEFARRVKALERGQLTVDILGEAEMEALGMGSLLCVGQGSARESQLVVIQWKGASDPNARPIAFLGKGVCFDTGGISIKPADGMEEMKTDMGGAAVVAGLLLTLATRKADVNVVGVLGLVENMPDGKAVKPGDVVTSMSGQTVEVINTDAEGRLVLADALWYCQNRFKPKMMIDLATLTGAIITALGHDVAGLFSNDDTLAEKLRQAGDATGEAVWRLPLPACYHDQLESKVADLKNLAGRPASAIGAALFLERFVNEVPWAHLDIAGVAWKKPSKDPSIPEGASGFGVRLLDRLVADSFEGTSGSERSAT